MEEDELGMNLFLGDEFYEDEFQLLNLLNFLGSTLNINPFTRIIANQQNDKIYLLVSKKVKVINPVDLC